MDRKDRKELLATEASSAFESFKIQINTYDSYMTTPTVFDRPGPPDGASKRYSFHHVPVIRVFGSLPTGHNILVHIHGVFPYIYVPFDNQNCFEFHRKLEVAIALSLKRNKEQSEDDDEVKNVFKYVAHVDVCKGVPFYGYHVGYKTFYKISLLNPSYVNRVADLLREGNVNNNSYDVYESHIPLPLQFLTDFNLFGCGWLKVSDLFIRLPILYDESLKTDELVDYLMGYNTTSVERIGNGALEIDVLAQDIMNRADLSERNLHHDFIEKFDPLKSGIYIQSTRDLWKDGEFQRRSKGMTSYTPVPPTQRDFTTKWVESEECESLFNYVKNMNPGASIDFKTFIKTNNALEDIPTAFQLFPDLFYQPEFESSPTDEESTNLEIESDEEFDDYLRGFNEDGQENGMEEDESDEREFEEEDSIGDGVAVTSMPSEKSAYVDNLSNLSFTQNLNSRPTLKRKYTQAFSGDTTKVKLPESSKRRFTYKFPCPVELNFDQYGLPKIQYDDPFYMEKPPDSFIFAGKKFKLKSKLLEHMDKGDIFDETLEEPQNLTINKNKLSRWKFLKDPPSFEAVEYSTSQLQPLTQIGITHKFKFGTQHTLERRPDGFNNLSLFIMELFVPSRDDLKPDPKFDSIGAIFWKSVDGNNTDEGLFIVKPTQSTVNFRSKIFEDELSMIEDFLSFVVAHDPDILSGYEVHASSWGYLIERAKIEYEVNVLDEISRVRFKSHNKMGDHWGYTHTSAIKVCGRHVLNIWRPIRELKLGRTSIEHVAYHTLHERIPYFSYSSLTSLEKTDLIGLIRYFMKRIDIDARLIEAADLIVKAAEEARLIGVDFYDVYYRGSQYKVESLMVRLAKAENFILYSPSKKQVRKQKPLECIPLVMEPISAYYKSPLLVLDFQSLYPSIMIAYNYCYSTLLGRLRNYNVASNPIGASKVSHPPGLLKLLEDDITLSPNGLMFVKSTVRKSLLAKMLEDLLDTRFMVKSTMKFLDPNLKRLYDNRQTAIKLTANVVYGYTSASFSGRMPCSDISDAIVQTGRETLENAISLIEGEPEWGAKVVYGDTDSLFVYLPGRSMEEAFKFGKEMAERVTKSNPDPVTLKFEKVYHPAVLLAKKRYVGYSFDELGSIPKFDAKGIETVRRDGHAAQQHIVEQCLRTLFETNNITDIKSYVQDQFTKIIHNDVSIQDFCFAKDVKIGTYKMPPPGAIVATKKMAADTRAEPQYRERVPYVIVEDHGKILRDRARAPEDFIKHNHKLDSEYYIVKTLIPPLERIFSLVGVNVRQWYQEMPKKMKKSQLYNNSCFSCGVSCKGKLCPSCKENELQTILNLRENMKTKEKRLKGLLSLCRSCTDNSNLCESHDCPVYFARVREGNKLSDLDEEKRLLKEFLDW